MLLWEGWTVPSCLAISFIISCLCSLTFQFQRLNVVGHVVEIDGNGLLFVELYALYSNLTVLNWLDREIQIRLIRAQRHNSLVWSILVQRNSIDAALLVRFIDLRCNDLVQRNRTGCSLFAVELSVLVSCSGDFYWTKSFGFQQFLLFKIFILVIMHHLRILTAVKPRKRTM